MKLSLFLPRPTPFYNALFAQMQRGLCDAGFEVSGACQLLAEPEAVAWAREHRPEVVFEMNRTRREAPFWPREIRHVTWIVDLLGRNETDLPGSDITYTFDVGWALSFPGSGFVDWFPPGTCPVTYAPRATEFLCDLTFVGHVPKPWSDEELARNVSRTQVPFPFRELLPQVQPLFGLDTTTSLLWRGVNDIVRHRTGSDIVEDPTVAYDIMNRIPRMVRSEMLSEVVRADPTARLFGSESLRAWPELASRYQGFLDGAAELAEAYRTSRFVLNEGVLMHFRTMDIMACGAIVLHRHSSPRAQPPPELAPPVSRPGGVLGARHAALIERYYALFQQGEHFFGYRTGELVETVNRLRADPGLCTRVREQAHARVMQGHTWLHRGQTLRRDLARALR